MGFRVLVNLEAAKHTALRMDMFRKRSEEHQQSKEQKGKGKGGKQGEKGAIHMLEAQQGEPA